MNEGAGESPGAVGRDIVFAFEVILMLSVLARGAVRAAAPSRVVERTIWSSDAVLRALRGLTARAMSGAPAAEEPAAGERERMEYDVLVVGAGPAGLSCAIKLKQLCQASGTELSVCVIEKGHEVGAWAPPAVPLGAGTSTAPAAALQGRTSFPAMCLSRMR